MSASKTNERAPAPPQPRQFPAWERWVVLGVSTLGGFMAAIQGSALIVALPDLMAHLETSINTIMWVMISYILVVAAIALPLGKIGDKLGRAVTYNIGFALFAIGGLLSGFSKPEHHGADLIGYRAIQGLGAAFIFVSSGALVADRFAPFNQVGLATGVIQLAFAAGTVVGPIVGGGALLASWSWVFWVTTIPAAIGCVLGFWKNKNVYPFSARNLFEFLKHYNSIGAVLIITAITLLVMLLSYAVFPDGTTVSSSKGLGLLGMGVVLGAILYVISEWRSNTPVIDGKMFLSRNFSIALVNATLGSFVRSSFVFAFIFFFQGPFSQSPLMAGVYVIPFGVGLMIAGLLSGRLADRMGARTLSVIGPFIAAIASIGTIFHNQHTNYGGIAVNIFILGFGWGIFNSPIMTLLMLAVPPSKRGEASALNMTALMLAQMLAIIFVFKFILTSLPFEVALQLFLYGGGGLSDESISEFLSGLHVVYYVCIALSVLAGLLSLLISRGHFVETNNETPATEDVLVEDGKIGDLEKGSNATLTEEAKPDAPSRKDSLNQLQS
ncbi:hypothetical protein HDV00_009025 [Rhizophlyctis rosea]|nr:hypothetical protein HDV00_009025 [Rhizophlyctis rosea]